MSRYPDILELLHQEIFNLLEEEKTLLKEAKELIEIEQYRYALFPIWSCIIINIQRRIEEFGVKNLFNQMEGSDSYDKFAGSLRERWLNVNEYKTVDYAKQLNVISHICHDLITSLYWMKNDPKQKELEKEEILSIIYLVEKNLFTYEFKKDQRKNESNIGSLKRRKSDIENSNSRPSKTHEELLVKSNVKKFEEELKKKVYENHIINYG